MGTVRQSFLVLPQRLWDVMFDPDMWSVNTQGFAPSVGRRFVIKDPPVLSTRFTGCFQCVVTDVQLCQRLEFAAQALTWSGPPTALIATFEFVELPGETHCTFTVCGVDSHDPAERLLDHIITESIYWGFHYINRRLERQRCRQPSVFGLRHLS
ncbi:SRPBCC domain-containing protein [Mycobacteroides saopaulense]